MNWTAALALYIEFARLMVERDRYRGMATMGKIDEFADNVPDILQEIDDEFGGLHERATALRERGSDVAAKWKAHFDGREKSLAAAEAAINRVSNIPLPDSPRPPPTTSSLTNVDGVRPRQANG